MILQQQAIYLFIWGLKFGCIFFKNTFNCVMIIAIRFTVLRKKYNYVFYWELWLVAVLNKHIFLCVYWGLQPIEVLNKHALTAILSNTHRVYWELWLIAILVNTSKIWGLRWDSIIEYLFSCMHGYPQYLLMGVLNLHFFIVVGYGYRCSWCSLLLQWSVSDPARLWQVSI